MRIFLCHSSFDKPIVREVARHFPDGIQSWIDEREIKIGQDIEEAIRVGIDSSRFLVLFLSRRSIESDWVTKEVQIALSEEEQVMILPVLLEDLGESFPSHLKSRRYVPLLERTEVAVKMVAGQIAADVHAWISEQDTVLRALENCRNDISAQCLQCSPEAARIAYYSIPKMVLAMRAIFEYSILGQRTKHHPPLWLVDCIHAMVHTVFFREQAGLLAGPSFEQRLHQAYLIGYYCGTFASPIASKPWKPKRALSGERVAQEADYVIQDIKQKKISEYAVASNDAAQTIVEVMTKLLYSKGGQVDRLRHVLGEAAWLGGVHAEAERRILG